MTRFIKSEGGESIVGFNDDNKLMNHEKVIYVQKSVRKLIVFTKVCSKGVKRISR